MRLVILGLVVLWGVSPWPAPVQAQEGGVLQLIESILQKLEELSGQIQDLRAKFSAQTQQFTELKGQLEQLKPLAAQLAGFQEQFKPLLDRWPEVEQALSAVRSLQSQLSGLQGTLEELKRQVGAARSNPDPRVDALQAQLVELERQLAERSQAFADMQEEFRELRTMSWGLLAAIALLFLWQLGQLLHAFHVARKPTAKR